jgi:hypothetical protein
MMQLPSGLSLSQVAKLARRCALSAVGLGVVALVACLLAGVAQVGFGMCIGLALAIVNLRLITLATVKASMSSSDNKKRPLVANTAARLAGITVVAIGIMILDHQLGLGVVLGLAVFQFLMLGNVGAAIFQTLRTDRLNGVDLVESDDVAAEPTILGSILGDDL